MQYLVNAPKNDPAATASGALYQGLDESRALSFNGHAGFWLRINSGVLRGVNPCSGHKRPKVPDWWRAAWHAVRLRTRVGLSLCVARWLQSGPVTFCNASEWKNWEALDEGVFPPWTQNRA